MTEKPSKWSKEEQARIQAQIEEVDRLCGIPTLRPEFQPKPKPEPPRADVIPLDPWPVQRRWTAEPTGPSSARPYYPTENERYEDHLRELRLANAAAARASRLRLGPAWVGDETIDEIVRRQEEGYK